MKTIGEFVFKGIEKREGGEFLNERGQNVKYPESYVLKVDEMVGTQVHERRLKIDISNTSLVDRLKQLKIYDKLKLECDVVLYNNSAKVVPVAICDSNNKS